MKVDIKVIKREDVCILDNAEVGLYAIEDNLHQGTVVLVSGSGSRKRATDVNNLLTTWTVPSGLKLRKLPVGSTVTFISELE